MKFNFKIQQYQTDAVDAVAKVFNGQGFHDKINYIRDLGNTEQNLSSQVSFDENEIMDDTGYKNELVELSDEQLLQNIQNLQSQNNIKLSPSLVKDLGRCSLDIEMETGTGKTYAYLAPALRAKKKVVLLYIILMNTMMKEIRSFGRPVPFFRQILLGMSPRRYTL